ncbi:MAG: hypothetical protein LBQ81_04825 [Zoogloeaceae bacterium]|jgi:hypothetical protein|nr:hypothetical protein [Zoogloeaceae bacterium]
MTSKVLAGTDFEDTGRQPMVLRNLPPGATVNDIPACTVIFLSNAAVTATVAAMDANHIKFLRGIKTGVCYRTSVNGSR